MFASFNWDLACLLGCAGVTNRRLESVSPQEQLEASFTFSASKSHVSHVCLVVYVSLYMWLPLIFSVVFILVALVHSHQAVCLPVFLFLLQASGECVPPGAT